MQRVTQHENEIKIYIYLYIYIFASSLNFRSYISVLGRRETYGREASLADHLAEDEVLRGTLVRRWVDGGEGRVRGRWNPGRQGAGRRYHTVGHVIRRWRHFGHRPLHRYCRLWRNGKRLVRHTLQPKDATPSGTAGSIDPARERADDRLPREIYRIIRLLCR